MQPIFMHLENADFIGRTETIFHRTQNSKGLSGRSPSKYNTVSTMCSNILGPASAPSFVT